MKISHKKENTTCELRDVLCGALFKYNDKYYICAVSFELKYEGVLCVDIKTGDVIILKYDTPVKIIGSEVIVYD